MAKFLIGVLTGMILLGIILLIAVFAIARVKDRPPTVADGSTFILSLDGEIPERAPVEYPIPFLDQRTPLTVENVWSLLRKAAVDSRVKAVLLEPRSLAVGWAKLEEIRADLEAFKKSGKPLYAYLQSPGTREYYLATAADRIYLTPEDFMNVKGMRFELLYFKKTLDKIGAEVEIAHAGKYKDFGDQFTRSSMSPETQEVLNSIIDDLYNRFLVNTAAGRKKTAEQMRAIIDDGPFTSQQALDKGLVDAVQFEDQVFGDIKKNLNAGEVKKLSTVTYQKVTPKSLGLEGKPRIALLVGEGGITRGGPEDDGLSGSEGIRAQGFNKLLRRVANDSDIKGVVVRIDSPGGEVAASDEILREMSLLSSKKPVVISMSDAAASGGYYISLTGDSILAYPGTFTGSIGVVWGKVNLHGLYDKLGLTKDFLMRGRFAAIDSDYKPLSPPEREKLQDGIDETYRSFVTKVAAARKRKFEEIEPLAQGRVWLGSQAKQRALVDELGGLDRAIELVKDKAKIGKTEKITLVTYPPRRSIFEVLLKSSDQASLEGVVRERLRETLSQAQVWGSGGMMRLMPYRIEVR